MPFRTVFINGLVRDEKGDKMSKTKGNDVDPLELIEQYGTDALRFTLVALATPGTDPSLSASRLLGYRAFVNKLWNASRFVLMNLEGERAPSYDRASLPLASRWILSRQQEVARRVSASLAEFRFDQAANELYHFVWDELCDWYIEIAKGWFSDPVEGPRVRAVLVEVLEKTLRLLHPVMPFVTEEIWQLLPHEGESIMVAPFPAPDDGQGRRRRGGGRWAASCAWSPRCAPSAPPTRSTASGASTPPWSPPIPATARSSRSTRR